MQLDSHEREEIHWDWLPGFVPSLEIPESLLEVIIDILYAYCPEVDSYKYTCVHLSTHQVDCQWIHHFPVRKDIYTTNTRPYYMLIM